MEWLVSAGWQARRDAPYPRWSELCPTSPQRRRVTCLGALKRVPGNPAQSDSSVAKPLTSSTTKRHEWTQIQTAADVFQLLVLIGVYSWLKS
jgi:hypothetical protein